MKGLSEDVDLTPLIGRQVEQVRFSKWSVQVLLDGEARIVIESHISIADDDDGERLEIVDYGANATKICSILGSRILDAQRTPDGGVKLRVSPSITLYIENSESRYESFQIHLEQALLVA